MGREKRKQRGNQAKHGSLFAYFMASNATAYCCWFCCSLQFGRLKCNASNCKSLAGRVRVWPGLAFLGLAWLQTINSARCGGNYVTILAIHNYRIQLQLHNSQANARRVSFLSLSVSFFLSLSLPFSIVSCNYLQLGVAQSRVPQSQ